MTVTGEVRGLKPGADTAFTSTTRGDLLQRRRHEHRRPLQPQRCRLHHGQGHVGDLPPLQADAQGVARINFTSTNLSLTDAKTSVVGHGLIVHRDPDDYTTQPTGNAGPRVAGGDLDKAEATTHWPVSAGAVPAVTHRVQTGPTMRSPNPYQRSAMVTS